jgi:2-polyprenyl-3-methyl-5-hydroxy-6-metoxy-1,4-benzoquinol methylase
MPEVMGFDKFAGSRLLEVGCGMGTDLLQFARGGAKVTGVDLTPRSPRFRSATSNSMVRPATLP